MSLKRLPNSLDEEELLKLLEKADNKEPEKKIVYKNDVLEFISCYKLVPGKNKVKKQILYNLYKKWSHDPIDRSLFNRELSKYFTHYTNSHGTYYQINANAIDLSVEAYKLVKNTEIDKTKSPHWKKSFEKFLSDSNLQPGKYYIEHYILYHAYDKWVYTNKHKTKLSRDQFHRFCMLYFERKRIGENRMSWFGINESFLDSFGQESIRNIRNGYEEKQEKERNKKRKKQTPRIRSGA